MKPTPNWILNVTVPVPCLNHKWLTRYLKFNWWESRLVNSQQWQFSSGITPWWVRDSSKLSHRDECETLQNWWESRVVPASGMNVTLELFQIDKFHNVVLIVIHYFKNWRGIKLSKNFNFINYLKWKIQ
jgi:hypothetical protein